MFFTKNPNEVLKQWKQGMKKEWKLAFLSAFFIGIATHMLVITNDLPNHDGLASTYFDQNMVTSGRWFLTVACGISSYFTLPWVIGLLAFLYLGITAAILVELLEIKQPVFIVLVSGLLVTYPALSATFAYLFTADGYMMALMLACGAVLLTKKYNYGFIGGGICLAFSMGTYQSYLSVTILLCIYMVLLICLKKASFKSKIREMANYLFMGILGTGLYFVILKFMLFIQGVSLNSYQGINSLEGGNKQGLLSNLITIYKDFFAFTLKGNVLFHNIFSIIPVGILVLLVLFAFIKITIQQTLWKKIGFYFVLLVAAIIIPVATNVILLISPEVYYHLLMRYQWIIFLICGVAFLEASLWKEENLSQSKSRAISQWLIIISVFVMVFQYGVTDNIAYSNMGKKYEKTYAYCLRLLDRMEQTEGYYTGIPVAMVGVVNMKNYPETDVTLPVTGSITGTSGDLVCYTGRNYQAFMKHYLNATIELVSDEEMDRIYDTKEYQELDSFPGTNSMKVVDGILYIKTE